ncbi:hypothetical protein Q9966_012355 [Columba livia]|nr:hypothetical protein Q9966_012355 [Columba livia]
MQLICFQLLVTSLAIEVRLADVKIKSLRLRELISAVTKHQDPFGAVIVAIVSYKSDYNWCLCRNNLEIRLCSYPVCGPLGNKQIKTGEHRVNFGIFLKILRMLISKLKAQQMSFHDYKYRLARSTLVLIPLLGIHEFVFTFITDEQVEGLSRHIRLFIQLTMSSFHGFFVAVLYCFANGEPENLMRKAVTGPWDARQKPDDLLGCQQMHKLEREPVGREDKKCHLPLMKQEVEETDRPESAFVCK